ncbi:MAG: BatD family protein [Bacteroidales bacterium]|nr:BatD family protein [Bacteroidales bacterium]
MKRTFTLLLMLACAFSAFAQNSLTVDAPPVVTTDETFRVVFTADGKMSDFEWPGSPDFTIVWGPQSGSMSSTSIVNGKRTSSHKETFTYILQAKAAGKFTLPAATAEIEKKPYTSNSFTIEVVNGETAASSTQQQQQQSTQTAPSGGNSTSDPAVTGSVSDKDIFLRLYTGKTNLIKGEPTTATLKLFTRADIAGFEDVRFPDFEGFWSKETYAPQNLEFTRENVDGVIYNTAVLRRYMLIPQQVGTLTIDPAEMVCSIRIISSAAPRSIFDSFFDSYQTIRKRISTPSVRVNVSALPAGAPESFCGGVGDFKMETSLSRSDLKANEAASLVVTIKGKGNISMLEPPKVLLPPDFEMYDMKSSDKTAADGSSGTRTFEFPFIPRSHGDFTIDPIEYSYYDTAKGRYVTLTSEPITVSVEKGDEIAGSGVAMPGVNRQDVRNIAEDIRFISTKSPSLRRSGSFFAGSPLFWGLLALVGLLFALASAIIRKMAARRGDVAGTRNRRANKMARARLKQAGEYLKQDLPTAYYEELHKAVLGYVSDKLAIPVADLSKENIREMLSARGVDEPLADRFNAIVDACEFARYAPESARTEMENLYEEAVNVISEIDSKVKKAPASGASRVAGILLLMLALASPAFAQDAARTQWKNAAEAYTAGDYGTALGCWKSILQEGVVSPDLYYNIGNACYKTGDISHAILYYEKCLKLDPSHSDAANNLEIAKALTIDKIDSIPEFFLISWLRKTKYACSADAWAWITILLAAVAAALFLGFRFLGTERGRRLSFIFACIVALLALFTLGFSLSERRDALKVDSAVMTQPVSSVKSSPGDAGKSIFVLHEGTKVKLLDELGSWRKVEISDGRQGWVENSTLEVI